VLRERIELSTSPLPRECSTTELPQQVADGGAGPGADGRLVPQPRGRRKPLSGSVVGRSKVRCRSARAIPPTGGAAVMPLPRSGCPPATLRRAPAILPTRLPAPSRLPPPATLPLGFAARVR
jgi:hypothetical protein